MNEMRVKPLSADLAEQIFLTATEAFGFFNEADLPLDQKMEEFAQFIHHLGEKIDAYIKQVNLSDPALRKYMAIYLTQLFDRGKDVLQKIGKIAQIATSIREAEEQQDWDKMPVLLRSDSVIRTLESLEENRSRISKQIVVIETLCQAICGDGEVEALPVDLNLVEIISKRVEPLHAKLSLKLQAHGREWTGAEDPVWQQLKEGKLGGVDAVLHLSQMIAQLEQEETGLLVKEKEMEVLFLEALEKGAWGDVERLMQDADFSLLPIDFLQTYQKYFAEAPQGLREQFDKILNS